MTLTQEKMDTLSRTSFLPVILVMNAWVFQYLLSVYFNRRREFRVCTLIIASFLVFATQLYLPDDMNLLIALNDISETSLQLTFIIQITLIGRAVSVKVKVRSIVWFTYVAEGFIIVGWINVVLCILDVADLLRGEAFHIFGNILESVSLVFVLVFRFFYLSMSMGFRVLVAKRKTEFLVFVLLVFHEFPFAMIEHETGISWEFPQAICHRVLMISCIVLNIRNKTRQGNRSSAVMKSKRESANQPPESTTRAKATFITTLGSKASTGRAYMSFSDAAKVAVTSARISQRD
ncbi:hypothetical protein P3T76_007651 [Phytophthora citrophthora]|uniref:Uncharacterized protein n=1 Tax=Phytophthora citrophthora TaxID=4793 RepID=A0AAD9GLW3_9STRA|nr:hypothetical protein P3T76_007651 [Phytophthora citrophthora]